MEMLEEIVRTDKKGRYSFSEDKTLIRANQGHSINVDVELEEKEPPEFLWHGTGEKFVSGIDTEGLIPKSRLYVHLSKDEDTALQVGARHGKPVLYKVLSGKMYKDGYIFYLSLGGGCFSFISMMGELLISAAAGAVSGAVRVYRPERKVVIWAIFPTCASPFSTA